ncbi:MAG: hypothetical protein PUQ00_05145 [Nostoc sp. S13]|nr:hypothetical protein [Nostoc sp. S13]
MYRLSCGKYASLPEIDQVSRKSAYRVNPQSTNNVCPVMYDIQQNSELVNGLRPALLTEVKQCLYLALARIVVYFTLLEICCTSVEE